MSISEKSFMRIWELAAGAEAANNRCVLDANRMDGFAKGLKAAIEILNAESDERAVEIAAMYRREMASLTGTYQESWRVGEVIPDANWVVK